MINSINSIYKLLDKRLVFYDMFLSEHIAVSQLLLILCLSK